MRIKSDCEIASRNNEIINNKLRHEWNNVSDVMYRPNSHISKRKPYIVKTIPARKTNLKNDILTSILPSKDELIFDILVPTIRRSIISFLQ